MGSTRRPRPRGVSGHSGVISAGGPKLFHRTTVRRLAGLGLERVWFTSATADARAAAGVAKVFATADIECTRVRLPARRNLAEVLAEASDPTAALDALTARASTPAPAFAAATTEPVSPPPTPAAPTPAIPIAEPTATEPAPAARVARDGEPVVSGTVTELHVGFAGRVWRIRGARATRNAEALRANVMVTDTGSGGFHLDSLDLYSARARAAFTTAAAHELHAPADELKGELGRVLVQVEAALAIANTAPELPSPTSAEHAAALDLLHDPDLGSRVVADLAALGIVGEEQNLLACYLAVVSRKNTPSVGGGDPVVVRGGEIDARRRGPRPGPRRRSGLVLGCYVTGQALYYVGEHDLAHKVLAIAEHEGATRASYALKLLVSDGRLAIGTTGKDPTSGKLATRTYHVAGPVALVTPDRDRRPRRRAGRVCHRG